MFGFSFGEVLVIVIIAVLFLGPDKLPQTFIDIAKFIRAVKKTINDAKEAIDREVHISEIKQEALEYKKKFEQGTNEITKEISENKSLNELSEILNAPLDSPSYKKDSADLKETNMQELESKGKEIASKVNLKKKADSKDSLQDSKDLADLKENNAGENNV